MFSPNKRPLRTRKSAASRHSTSRRWAAIAGAVVAALNVPTSHADVSTNTHGPVQNGQTDGGTGNSALNNPAETISFSGAVSFATYIQTGAISLLTPGTSITLHNGSNGGGCHLLTRQAIHPHQYNSRRKTF